MSIPTSRSFEYLEGLPGTTFNRLYKQPSTVLAIFRRMLTHMAKSFVMALLYISRPMPVTDLEAWVRPDGKRERDNAIGLLERMHILTARAKPGKGRAYSLTNPFASSLRLALTGGGHHSSFGVPCDVNGRDRVSVAELDDFARRQWEGVLSYMVGSTGVGLADDGVRLSLGVKELLKIGNLVEVRGRNVNITKEGFAFILQEVNAQVWTILILYLQNAEALNMDECDVLSFLFMLGSLELGLAYSKANLSETQLQMLQDLGDYGIIYQPSDPPTSASLFYPTRLATTLTSDTSGLRSSSLAGSSGPASSSFSSSSDHNNNRGFIVIETNYRIYAYTSSTLQIAILSLFSRLTTRYPNMVAGKLTRESIRRAVGMGITSEQIISFLTTHAHPQMYNNSRNNAATILPPTVVDQIRLWQLEGDRMKATVGFLFKDFNSQAEYESVARYAEEIGVCVWKQDRERRFFVTSVQQVAAFLKGKSAAAKGS